MSAQDVTALLARAMCDALVESPLDEPCEGCKMQAAAIRAAVRAMTHAEQAELLGGGSEIETVPLFITSVGSGEVLRRWSRSRVVGPWQEKP